MKKFALLLFFSFYAYAIIRYHFGKNIPWGEWYFILNKSFAWTGFTLISLSILPEKTLNKIKLSRRTTGISGFLFVLVHSLSFLILISPEHFPKFYSENEINLTGWLAIVTGILSLTIFTIPFIAALKKLPGQSKVFSLGKIGVIVCFFHPLVIGSSGWLHPESWPYLMPPITLLAFLTGIAIFTFRIFLQTKRNINN